jgi:protein-S-isoprenylcysteine O-methyltransferase Ste14
MSAVPGFDLGLWNAWWFLAYYMAHPLLMMALDRDMAKKMESDEESSGIRERVLMAVLMGSLVAAFGYSIGCPLRTGTWWFYLGVPFAVGGLLLFTVAMLNIAHTPLGQPFTTGLYRFSRHPMAVWGGLGLIGAGIASASWLLLLLVVISQAAYFLGVDAEERHCLATYGDAYRTYRERTPKYLGFPRRAAP